MTIVDIYQGRLLIYKINFALSSILSLFDTFSLRYTFKSAIIFYSQTFTQKV